MALPISEVIVTSHLWLISITPQTLNSELAEDNRLGELIQCVVPPNWPPVDWEPHVYKLCLAQFEEHPEQIGWHRYVGLVQRDGSRRLIGAVGAFSKSIAECEIGYSILPPFESRGFATEAAKALIDLLRRDERVESVIAHSFPSLVGSIRVMEKCGMTFVGEGEEEGTIRYQLRLKGRDG